MFPSHVALYQFVNLSQNDLEIEHSTNKWSAVWTLLGEGVGGRG